MHLFFTNFQLPNLFNHTTLCLVLSEAIKTSHNFYSLTN
jgi:hypothetical protein